MCPGSNQLFYLVVSFCSFLLVTLEKDSSSPRTAVKGLKSSVSSSVPCLMNNLEITFLLCGLIIAFCFGLLLGYIWACHHIVQKMKRFQKKRVMEKVQGILLGESSEQDTIVSDKETTENFVNEVKKVGSR